MRKTIIRPASDEDLEAILAIYNECVLNSTATFDIEPRSLGAQREWAKQFQHPYVLLVAEEEGEVTAWGCLHPFGAKPGYRFTSEDSVYVRRDARGRRVGGLVLRELVRAGAANGFHSIIARISGENPARRSGRSSEGGWTS
jgi:phosphinothricin acetyltransferase